jgi:tetratricopeptide (TPR) repeat protein
MGDAVSAITATRSEEATAAPGTRGHQIRGNVPLRNRDFTGRDELLEHLRQALESTSKASVLPRALHGLGGVGKTQLAVEYVYRYGDQYDLIWWISAEEPSLALSSLATLCEELRLPLNRDQKQAAETVLRSLSTSQLKWLLVFDNADDPADIVPLVPTAGGDVIITSRNQAWTTVGQPIEVDVFARNESVELLQKRGASISTSDASRLADKLGDLPLALDQAASWHAATGMPVSEYLELFDSHVRDFLSEGKPASYRTTVAASVTIALNQLRQTTPAAVELLALFAYLGAEPISVGLLRRAKDAALSEVLRELLREQINLNRAIRELTRHGLARLHPDQRIQVHRLVQMVLREELGDTLAAQSLENVQRILASANPSQPDLPEDRLLYQELGPHVVPAQLTTSDLYGARQVVLDEIRYLYVVGDYEGSRKLAESALEAWSTADGRGLGEDGELTLIAMRHLANTARALGDVTRARELDATAFQRLTERPQFGPYHEHTIATATGVGQDLRLAGEYRQALQLDRNTLEAHVRVFGEDDAPTLRAQSNLAVNLRMLGNFADALKVDEDVVRRWAETVSTDDPRYLACEANLARDLYGLGRYTDVLTRIQRIHRILRDTLGPGHLDTLHTARTLAMALRKTGKYRDALKWSRTNYRDCHAWLGPHHEHTLAATMTHANSLRAAGEIGEARGLAEEAVKGYHETFGRDHPLTLVANANMAVALRSAGEHREARRIDEEALTKMEATLGAEHGYTLCVANNLANDLFLSADLTGARPMSQHNLEVTRRVRGPEHPYSLACATNAALDLQATGDDIAGQDLLDATVTALARVLGPEHPETVDASRFKRAECDIEPPPT